MIQKFNPKSTFLQNWCGKITPTFQFLFCSRHFKANSGSDSFFKSGANQKTTAELDALEQTSMIVCLILTTMTEN